MTRSIFRGVIGAAVLAAVCVASQASHAQDSWNHGFGARNYGYAGDAYSNPNFGNSTGFGYTNSYVTGFTPYNGYSPYYAGYYPYYGGFYPNYGYSGVGLGAYSNGGYAYSISPGFYSPYGYGVPNRNMGARSNVGAAHPKAVKNQPRGVQQQPGKKAAAGHARAW